MPSNSVDQWVTGRAELEIRRWLYGIDQWDPEVLGADARQGLYEPPFGKRRSRRGTPGQIFDFQARALGLHIATLAMALDPHFVVIGAA